MNNFIELIKACLAGIGKKIQELISGQLNLQLIDTKASSIYSRILIKSKYILELQLMIYEYLKHLENLTDL